MKNIDKQLDYQLSVESIRKRPGMYVGSKSLRGVNNLIFNLVEEIICISNKTNILITINLNEDDMLYFTFDNSIDLRDSIELKIIKALSDVLELNFENEYYIYNKGLLISKTDMIDNYKGISKIIFRPDKDIFSYESIDYYMIFNRIKELAQLNENVKFILSDNENKNIIQFRHGLDAMLNENICFIFGNRNPLNLYFVTDSIEISVSMVYEFASDVALSYVNNLKTFDGGTHVEGLYDGIFCAFKSYIEKYNNENIKITKNDVIEDLNFIISVKMDNPEFGGAVKRELTNKEIRIAVKHGVIECLYTILESDQSFLDDSRAIQKAEARNIVRVY